MPKETNKRTARQKDADELHMTSNLAAPSINLLTLIEANTSSIDTTLDITQSSFRDAIRGANTKDFSTIQTVLDSIKDTDGIKKITDTVTIAGIVTANAGTNLNTSALAKSNTETDDGDIAIGETREALIALPYIYVDDLEEWHRLRGTDADPHSLYVFIKGNEGILTVTQAAKDRTVTGTVTTEKGDTSYTKVKKTGFYSTQQSDTTLWTPAAGKKFVITDIIVSVDTAMRIYLNDDATKIWEWHLAANGGCVINLQTPDESAAINNTLSITMDATGKCSIKVLGYEV